MVCVSVLQENLPLTLCHLWTFDLLSDRVILCFVSDLFPSLSRRVEAYLCEGRRGQLAHVPSTAPSTPAGDHPAST